MRAKLPIAVLAGLLLAVPGFAQSTPATTPDPGTTGQVQSTPDPGTSGQTTAPPATPVADERDLDNMPNEFVISGFVGGSFARSALNTSVDFGGTFDYLHSGAFGAEFLAGFAPKFKLDRLAGAESDVNNYMANVIAAVPVGYFHAVRPFVSAGVGAITLSQNNNSNQSPIVQATANLFQPSETHFGGNIGGGIMAFTGAYGIRADVRYFSALGHKNASSPSTAVPGTLLSVLDDVSFWRANVGFAFRF